MAIKAADNRYLRTIRAGLIPIEGNSYREHYGEPGHKEYPYVPDVAMFFEVFLQTD